ncbi:MAG TPA: tyrosine-type recombinase/integrase [Chloroflexota bacterium]|nr:tyrosine-type recombinase/integrase [Chloroflexota bacterium]
MSTKRRGHGEGTIRHRPDGLWEARLSLPNGKRKSVYGKTRKDVQDKLRASQRDLDAGLDVGAPKQTVERFLTDWLADVAEPSLRPGTLKSYESYVRLHIIPAIGHHRLDRLTPQHVQAMLHTMTRKGLAPRTVQYARAILRRALGYALKWSLVGRNVATMVEPPRSVRKPVQPLDADLARRFLTATRDDRLGPLFHVAIGTGLRQGELFGLRWQDVDLTSGTLTVRHALQRINGTRMLVEPKTDLSRRTVTLPASAVGALRTQRTRQLEARLLAGARWQEADFVFTSTIGTPLEPSNVVARLHRLLAEAGLPRQRFHDLRHCAASLLLAGGVAPRTIMGILGHSQISLTMNTYAHLSPALEHDAAARLDALIAVAE